MKIIRISAIWCPSCLIMKKRWEQIEKEYPHLTIEDYDYDMDEEYCKTLKIGTKLPVCILMEDEKELTRFTGEHTEKEMKKILEEYGVDV